MFGFTKNVQDSASSAIFDAISRSQAVIEFNLDGTIITANENFLNAMGYSLEEIQGKHHRMFVEPAYGNSDEYKAFWETLNRGEFLSAEYKRIGKGGKEIWIQASYNPILDGSGKPIKVIKFASDVTEQKLMNADFAGQIDAISKSQAVIEFNMDGTIRKANENFLNAMGYTLGEVQGKHHSMFVEPAYADSAEYKVFWETLNRGEFLSAEYKRIGKGGKEIWIQASYNPILDMSGKPFKVVKYATDVTEQKISSADHAGQIAAISKSQAVIEFNMDGTIRKANENFLGAMGYTLAEVQGKHHRMFVEADYGNSSEYAEFWARLNRGEFFSDEYKRIAKGGREVWIQASYNPILDLNNEPFKVVKYASDVTEQVLARQRAEHIRELMENVAAGAEELNVSVKEIAENMARSRETTAGTFDRVVAADQETQSLAKAAEAMGGIVELINGITENINLLALNAAIEAARAGEAGKGFAVVASEVKNLASQARSATSEISREIENMCSVSDTVVDSLTEIRNSTEKVLEYVSTTAAAVEEQSAVASEMSTSMQRAAEEATRIGQ